MQFQVAPLLFIICPLFVSFLGACFILHSNLIRMKLFVHHWLFFVPFQKKKLETDFFSSFFVEGTGFVFLKMDYRRKIYFTAQYLHLKTHFELSTKPNLASIRSLHRGRSLIRSVQLIIS